MSIRVSAVRDDGGVVAETELRRDRGETKQEVKTVRLIATTIAIAACMMLAAATNARAVNRTPPICTDRLAPRLCAIHAHHHRTNEIRRTLGLPPISYGWRAERYPALRDRILTYWTGVHRRHVDRLERFRELIRSLYYVPADVRANLLCIHPFEEPSWSTVAGGLGFVYPPSSYIGSVHPSYQGKVSTLVGIYGNSWYGWPMNAQLVVGAGLVANYGYSPWTTAHNCV